MCPARALMEVVHRLVRTKEVLIVKAARAVVFTNEMAIYMFCNCVYAVCSVHFFLIFLCFFLDTDSMKLSATNNQHNLMLNK